MPATSRRAKLAFLRRRLLSPDRYVDALLVVEDHQGNEVFRVGGCWDRQLRAYVDRPCVPHVVKLEESQLAVARAFARWLAAAQANKKRRRALFAGGNRGSGKTYFFAGIAMVAVALAFPGCWQFGVNITAKQKRECIEAIRECAAPAWIAEDIADFRDPRTIFLTGATTMWLSAQNPRAIRSAGLDIRNVFINEGQDQPESVFINGIAAIRNSGGLVTVATNPPQMERGDWVASVWQAIEAGTLNGEIYLLDNKLNRSIDQDSVDDIGQYLRAVNLEAWQADANGVFSLSGPIAYPAFKSLPVTKGGHIGAPPNVGWKDVTAEVSGAAIDSDVGYPYVCGVDFQREPGIIGTVAKIYRDERGMLVLHALGTIGVRGVEPDFSQALVASGYSPAHGMTGAPMLLIGDGTGARQNAEHRFGEPPSFDAMKADGWKIVPPMYHWRRGTAWNPLVKDSRAQMHALLENKQILIAPKCADPDEGFPSLIESLRRAKVGPKGGLIEKGNFQHGPDGFRYLAWKFLPRPKPPQPQGGLDMDSYNALRNTKIGWGK